MLNLNNLSYQTRLVSRKPVALLFGKAERFFIRNIRLWVVAGVDLVVSSKLMSLIEIGNIFSWFLVFAVYTMINGAVVFVIYMMLRESSFVQRVSYIIKRKRQ